MDERFPRYDETEHIDSNVNNPKKPCKPRSGDPKATAYTEQYCQDTIQ